MVTGELVIQINGDQPVSDELVAALAGVCDSAEDRREIVIVHVSRAPGAERASELQLAMVSRWERVLRRLERLPAVTVAVADGDCGGAALDVLLATDYRIASATSRLLLPVVAGATWPGMALYRLTRQASGAAPARRAVLFGTPITADAALAMGVLDEVADDVRIAFAKAREVAAAVQGTELAIRRQLMTEALTTTFEDALGVHLAACDRALRRTVAAEPAQ